MEDETMKKAARLLVENGLNLRHGDKILVLTDDGISDGEEPGRMRDAVIAAMRKDGHDPCVMCFPAKAGMGNPIPAPAEAAGVACDVLVSFNSDLLLYAENFPKIYQGGKTDRRMMLFPAGNSIRSETGYFARMMPQSAEEIRRMAEDTGRYGALLMDGREHRLRLTAANGTDLTFTLGHLGGSAHTGICAPGTIELIPAGILSLGVDEGSAEGTLVADYSATLWKRPLRGAIRFEIHGGWATSVSGGVEADAFLAAAAAAGYSGRETFNLAEFGLGFNPRAQADGQVTDGENIRGGAHIGIGANHLFGGGFCLPAWHVDFMLPRATVSADGTCILKDGTCLL